MRDYPIIPCNLCGSQPNSQRQKVKAMLAQWDERLHPGRVENVLGGLCRVSPSQLLDRDLYDFNDLAAANASIRILNRSAFVFGAGIKKTRFNDKIG